MVDLPITKWIKKKIRRLIGIVEDTDVATHSIASGKYVVWKGDLYKSTAAIAVGGSLSLSNLSPVSDGGFNEVSEQIGKHELGTGIDISSYTSSSNMFEAPSDGFIIINSGTASGNSGNLLTTVSGSSVYLLTVRTVTAGYGVVSSLFVRKGFKAYVALTSSTATFRPLQ